MKSVLGPGQPSIGGGENIWGRKTFGGGKHLGRKTLGEENIRMKTFGGGKHLGEERFNWMKTFGK